MTKDTHNSKYFFSTLEPGASNLGLSMIIQPSAFLYAISSNEFTKIEELCHVEIGHDANTVYDSTQNIKQLVSNYLLLQKKFKKVNVCFLNSDFAIAPSAYSSQLEGKSLLNFSAGSKDIKNPLQHNLKNASFIYTINQELLTYIERSFPNASLRHSGAVAISLQTSHPSLQNSELYLNLCDGVLEISAKRNSELLFYNNYAYSNHEDVLYYLLFSMEQFELSPLEVKLVLSGQIESNHELVKNLRKYIKHLNLCVHHPSIALVGDFSKLPQHYYFTLLNQHLCEL